MGLYQSLKGFFFPTKKRTALLPTDRLIVYPINSNKTSNEIPLEYNTVQDFITLLGNPWNIIGTNNTATSVNDDIYHNGKVLMGLKESGFKIYTINQEINIGGTDYSLPSAKAQYINEGTGDIYTAGVEDATSVPSGSIQAILACFNPTTFKIVMGTATPDGFTIIYNDPLNSVTNKIIVNDTGVSIEGLQNFADDAAAATGGIPINGLYKNGNIIQIRLT